jgi:hypothetical protein
MSKGQPKLTDADTYFHNYMNLFAVMQDHLPKDFTTCHSYTYGPSTLKLEDVVFIEIKVQRQDGKIPLDQN